MRCAGLRELKFRFDFEGSKVVFDVVSRDGRLAHNHRHNSHEEVHSTTQTYYSVWVLIIFVFAATIRLPKAVFLVEMA